MSNQEKIEKAIVEIENYFSSAFVPTFHVKLSQAETILDCKKFIESHLCAIRAYPIPTLYPYLRRRYTLKKMIVNGIEPNVEVTTHIVETVNINNSTNTQLALF